MGKRYKLNRNTVMDRLHPSIHKTSFEIKKEIMLSEGATEEEVENRSVTPVTRALIFLEQDGYAQGRERVGVSEEVLRLRGGRPVREYRLSEEGLRRRSKQLRPDKSSIDGVLGPA